MYIYSYVYIYTIIFMPDTWIRSSSKPSSYIFGIYLKYMKYMYTHISKPSSYIFGIYLKYMKYMYTHMYVDTYIHIYPYTQIDTQDTRIHSSSICHYHTYLKYIWNIWKMRRHIYTQIHIYPYNSIYTDWHAGYLDL